MPCTVFIFRNIMGNFYSLLYIFPYCPKGVFFLVTLSNLKEKILFHFSKIKKEEWRGKRDGGRRRYAF